MWLAFLVLLILLIVGLFLGFFKVRNIFLEHWVPALITGVFLVGILPVANQAYWMLRKNFEKSAHDRSKRYELVASTAKTYTILFKTHTRLHHLAQERSQIEQVIQGLTAQNKANTSLIQIYAARLAAVDALQSDLEKNRIQLEGQLGAISAMILSYLPDVTEQFGELAVLYDRRTSEPEPFLPTQEDPVVRGAYKLIGLMAKEVKEHEFK